MDINRQDHQLGYSVIHELVFIKDIPALELCLKLGADPDRKAPKTGTFALYDSISKDNIELFRTLVSGGADPNQFEDRFANTALHAAIMDNLTTHAKLLLRSGADPDRSNRLGLTPLLLSVSIGNDLITTLLLENGADPDIPSSKGVYPLDVAKFRKREEAVRILRQYGAIKRKSVPQ